MKDGVYGPIKDPYLAHKVFASYGVVWPMGNKGSTPYEEPYYFRVFNNELVGYCNESYLFNQGQKYDYPVPHFFSTYYKLCLQS